MDKIKELLGSRKFWVTAGTCVAIFAAEGKAGLTKITGIVAAYLVSLGATDVAKILKNGNAPIVEEAPKP